jgi:acyl carrier protein
LISDVLEQVRTIASDIFSVPLARIQTDSTPESIESWDSIQHLNLAITLEERFNVQLSPEEIEQMRDIGQIAKMIETKLQSTPN